MSTHPAEHLVPAKGEVMDRPLAELFGSTDRHQSPSPQLREDLEKIRESEQKAEEAGASIRLY